MTVALALKMRSHRPRFGDRRWLRCKTILELFATWKSVEGDYCEIMGMLDGAWNPPDVEEFTTPRLADLVQDALYVVNPEVHDEAFGVMGVIG